MKFTNSIFLYLTLALIPIIIGIGIWANWRWQRDLKIFGELTLIKGLIKHFSSFRRQIKGVVFILGILLLGIALAGPQYGVKMVKVKRQGVDVVIALDVSRSMLAEDVKPNRLKRAQQELSTLVDSLRGDRIGVIAFAGSAHIACPLTTDYTAAKMFLNYINPDTVALPGTSLGEAIRTAVKVFPQGGEGFRVLVLLTDGEDHTSKPLLAAEEAKAAGVKILSIGFGTPDGEPIPRRCTGGAIKGYVKDKAGNTVLSKLDESTLKKITTVTEGLYLPAYRGNLEAKTIADKISQMKKRKVAAGEYGTYEDRFQYVLLPALLLILLALWLPLRKGAWFLFWWGLCIFCVTPQLRAGVAEEVNQGNKVYNKKQYEAALKKYQAAQKKAADNSIVQYNMGNALQRLEKYEEAEKAYERALKTKNKKLKAKTNYNLGNNYLKQKKYKEAIKQYRKTLRLDPKDEDALYNLAQALMLLKQPPPQSQKSNKDKDKDKDKQDQKKQEQNKAQAAQAQEGKDEKDQTAQEQAGKSELDQPSKAGEQKAGNKGPDDKGEEQAGADQSQETPDLDNEERTSLRPGEMSKENAENILEAVREYERQAQQERMRKIKKQGLSQGKADW